MAREADEQPLDLSALDCRRDPRFEALVASMLASAAPELARRRRTVGAVGEIVRWARPILLAASIVGAASIYTLSRQNIDSNGALTADGFLPLRGAASLVASDTLPTAVALLYGQDPSR